METPKSNSFINTKKKNISESTSKDNENITVRKIRRKSPVRQSVSKKTIKTQEPSIKRKKNAGQQVKKVSFDFPCLSENVIERSDTEDDSKLCDTKEIDSLYFNFFSDEEIENFSVIEITETKFSGENSLFDLRLGPLDNGVECETCEQDYKACPGHFGRITLEAKIPHPLRSKSILEYLSLFCNKCHRLVILKEKIQFLGFQKYKGDLCFKKLLNEVEKNVKVCPHCETVIPVYSCIDDKYMMEINDKKYPLHYDEIYKIFSNIREEEVSLLGLDGTSVHPIRLIISKLLVVPPCVRPYIRTDNGENSHDDLNFKYIDIIKTNNNLKKGVSEKTRIDEIDKLFFHIKTIMDNNKGKARDNHNKRAIKCIKKRISSKQGRIRQNIQGKRAEFSARTVIGPDAMCKVDELIVPPTIAKTLSYPVKVNKNNIDYCYKLLEQDKVNYILRDDVLKSAKIVLWTQGIKLEPNDQVIRDGCFIDVQKYEMIKEKKFEFKPGDKIIRDGKYITDVYNKQPKRKKFELKEGDILERQLQDGDLCVFNRQPTLWKGSMRAKRIRILPGTTFRFNLASTQAFNADYDGDEINLQTRL